MLPVDSSDPLDEDLVSPLLQPRAAASRRASITQRETMIASVHETAGLPRPGTSGAANAYLLLVGSEFGNKAFASGQPTYSDAATEWPDLWRLRVGAANPHFDACWQTDRVATTLWHRLYRWLPEALNEPPSIAHSMFCWANLSVTTGGSDLGTRASHWAGMQHHVGPLIGASHCRIVGATNNPTMEAVFRWAHLQGASIATEQAGDEELEVLCVPSPSGPTLVAKVGHPSRGVSRTTFVERVSALCRRASETAT